MKDRTTPENIQKLGKNEVFVFGSNESGAHAGGAAKLALDSFGAQEGNPEGIQGKSYAIPTVAKKFKGVLEIEEIKVYVDRFIEFAKKTPDKIFFVTEIGCGIAGLKHRQVAPLFKNAMRIKNICLPEKFWAHINA